MIFVHFYVYVNYGTKTLRIVNIIQKKKTTLNNTCIEVYETITLHYYF